MSEETPPPSTSPTTTQGLGSVPMKLQQGPKAVTKPLTVPLKGVTSKAPDSLPGGGTPPSPIGPPPSPPSSKKGLIIGLSVVIVGLAAFSGYAFMKGQELQKSLDEVTAKATSLEKDKQTLDADLKKTREEFDAANKAHEEALTLKGQELDTANASIKEKTEELAKEGDKIRELQTQVDAAVAIAEEKNRLANELEALKTTAQETADQKTKADEEVARLTLELAKRKTAPAPPIDNESTNKPAVAQSETNQQLPSIEDPAVERPAVERPAVERPAVERKPKKKKSSLAWVRLGRHENGKNKGLWYFVAPDGFSSPLYASSEMAVRAAEIRAGHPQPDLKKFVQSKQ